MDRNRLITRAVGPLRLLISLFGSLLLIPGAIVSSQRAVAQQPEVKSDAAGAAKQPDKPAAVGHLRLSCAFTAEFQGKIRTHKGGINPASPDAPGDRF